MKYKLLLLIIVIVVIVIAIVILSKRKPKLSFKNTTSFRLSFTQGYMMNSDSIYEYKLENDKYIMSIKPYLIDRENISSFEVDKSIIEEIETIFNKYEVYKWDGFNKSDQDVLDGDSFSFSLDMNDNHISASGYMKWPENYGKVKSEIVNIFEREFEKNK